MPSRNTNALKPPLNEMKTMVVGKDSVMIVEMMVMMLVVLRVVMVMQVPNEETGTDQQLIGTCS